MLSLAPAIKAHADDAKRPALHALVHELGRAHSFHDALRHQGASETEAEALVTALQGDVDFRRAAPEDQLVFWRDGNATLMAFEYRAAGQETVRAERDARGQLRGSRVELERRRIAKGTRITGSLGQSLQRIGFGGKLTRLVEKTFAAKISLSKDARPGDSIKMIVDGEYAAGKLVRFGMVHALEYKSRRAGKLQAFWFEREHGKGQFFDARGRALRGPWLRTPLHYDQITSGYNLKRRHPILKRIMPHYGVDYSACRGTPVWAAADGQVTFAGRRGPNGNLVSLRHASGYESHYAHLSKIGKGIRPGRRLKQRQVLGYVGSTGRSTGPHLHFALKRNGHFVNPATQLDGPGAPLPRTLAPKFRRMVRRLRAELARIVVTRAPRHPATR